MSYKRHDKHHIVIIPIYRYSIYNTLQTTYTEKEKTMIRYAIFCHKPGVHWIAEFENHAAAVDFMVKVAQLHDCNCTLYQKNYATRERVRLETIQPTEKDQ